jgi:uncharacterized repeat protein (TIGR01451 family)
LTQLSAPVEVRDGVAVVGRPSASARPGQRLRYTIVAVNTGDRAAAKLVPTTKIPQGETYVAGSAGAAAEFSVDGGATWSPDPIVRVTNPGGAVTTRRALPAEYNAIRWIVPAPLAPGSKASFAYDVIVE